MELVVNKTGLAVLLTLLCIPLSAQADEEAATTEPPAEPAAAEEGDRSSWPAASDLLAALDDNLVFETRTADMRMTIEGRRRPRVMEIRTFGRGEEDSAMEFLSPAREAGTKMLKIDEDMWMYLPSVDRTQRISGHMMRQGMMGSDLSYDDMMTSRQFEELYTAEVVGEAELDGRSCWQVEMTAVDETVAYPRRVTWVDKETKIPLKQELYALSGMLLKTWTMGDIQPFEGGRQFPMRMVIEDHVRQGSRTIVEFSNLVFGVELEEEVFSRRWLERN